MKMHLNEGEKFVEGRSTAKARELLEKAEAAGLAGQVRTTSHGYIVPEAILDAEVEGVVESDEGDGDEKTEGDVFDPSEHKVDDVLAYLADADEDERQRVLTAESEGKTRSTILSFTAEEEK
jgi:hypothetical protein